MSLDRTRRAFAFVVAVMTSAAIAMPAAASSSAPYSNSKSANPPPLVAAKNPRLDSRLSRVASAAELHGAADAARVAREGRLVVSADRVRVVVRSSNDRATSRGAITAVGGRVENEYADLVEGLVPVTALKRLADWPGIAYVGAPNTPVADAVTDEAVAGSNASVWHTGGITGAGVKVAVIDVGFKGYTGAQASGDLPGGVTTQNFGCADFSGVTASTHGTAVAELVYKMAPGAQLYLICIADSIGLGQAKDYAIAQGVKIINHSASWFNTSRGDGTGVAGSPDAIAADARTNGILWVNSSGNSATRHWIGSYAQDSASYWNVFAPGDIFNDIFIASGDEACFYLKWDNWPASNQDYDVYLYRSVDVTAVRADPGGPVVPLAGSTNFQDGSQPPTEDFCYKNQTGTSQSFGVAIWPYSVTAAPLFHLFVSAAQTPQYVSATSSITEPGSSPSTMAAGAVCWQTSALQPYSGQGPTIDGRIKPDITGQDATSSSVYGAASGCTAGFLGTSASSPHVAGAAALVAQLNPTYTPAQLQTYLEGRAVDLGTGGKDSLYGAGRLSLGPLLFTPVVTGISPTFGPPSGGTLVTVTGTNLNTNGTPEVGFGTNYVTATCTSSTSCTATTPLMTGEQIVHVTMRSGNIPSATSAADYFTYASPTTVEETDALMSYSGGWNPWASGSHSGGAAKYSNLTGSSVGTTFNGPYAKIIFFQDPNGGNVSVTVDGAVVATLDSYAAVGAYRQVRTYITGPGNHSIVLRLLGTKNPASGGTYFTFDAFQVDSTVTGVTFEETAPEVAFSGPWNLWGPGVPSLSGGSAKYAYTAGGSASFVFSGTYVKVVYYGDPNGGIANVSIDGVVVDQFDTYAAAPTYQLKRLYSTAAGVHSITATITGTNNGVNPPQPGFVYVTVDAFIAEAAPAGTTFEDTSPEVTYQGSWNLWGPGVPALSGGSARYSFTQGQSVGFVFSGTYVKIVYYGAPDAGIATIYIDGAFADQFDTYFPSSTYQLTRIYSTRPGTHSVLATVQGAKNGVSTDVFVTIDAFKADVSPAGITLEDNNAGVTFSGAWSSQTNASLSGGSAKFSATPGATASMPFTGSYAKLVYYSDAASGIVSVRIDGLLVDSFDMYSAAPAFLQRRTYSTSTGSHTIQITVTGTKNGAASDAKITFDAFNVTASP